MRPDRRLVADNHLAAVSSLKDWAMSIPDLPSATLQRIVPIAEGRVAPNVALTLTSLEIYSTGFYLNVRLDWSAPVGLIPQISWTARDAAGGVYSCYGCAGNGGEPAYDRPGEDERPHTWRVGCSFGPALDPKAARLTLELESLKLLIFPEARAPGISQIARAPGLLLRRRRTERAAESTPIVSGLSALSPGTDWRFEVDLRPAGTA
jgi:hypothetical protein